LAVLGRGSIGHATSFGQFGPRLANGGCNVVRFDYRNLTDWPAVGAQTSIFDIGRRFGEYILNNVLGRGGRGYKGHINVVTHSMGGLVVRSYMVSASYESGTIRRLVSAGAPHFGAKSTDFAKGAELSKFLTCNPLDYLLQVTYSQAQEMEFGRSFLWDVHERWQATQPIDNANVLTIAGV